MINFPIFFIIYLRVQEYLFDSDSVLINYIYVQSCLELGDIPKLSPFLVKDLVESLRLSTSDCEKPMVNNKMPPLPSILSLTSTEAEEETASESLWNLTDYFAVSVRNCLFLPNWNDGGSSSGAGEVSTMSPNPLYTGAVEGDVTSVSSTSGSNFQTLQTNSSSWVS